MYYIFFGYVWFEFLIKLMTFEEEKKRIPPFNLLRQNKKALYLSNKISEVDSAIITLLPYHRQTFHSNNWKVSYEMSTFSPTPF